MEWIEKIPGEIWVTEEFLPKEMCYEVLDKIKNSETQILRSTEGIQRCFKSLDINYNTYDYIVYHYDIRTDAKVLNAVSDRLDELLMLDGLKAPRENLNALQCFVKSFGTESHYDLHAESATKYGKWGFIHYLSDEDEGDLIFPDNKMLEEYLEAHPEQKETWEGNKKILESFGEKTSVIGPFVMKPRFNHCIFFKTQSAHWVEPMKNVKNDTITRPTIIGWPHASKKMLDDLNRDTAIDEYFGLD